MKSAVVIKQLVERIFACVCQGLWQIIQNNILRNMS